METLASPTPLDHDGLIGPHTAPVSCCRHALIRVTTCRATEFVDITDRLDAVVATSGLRACLINVQALHTTTGIVVNEHEPLLLTDFESTLHKVAPSDERYRHDDLSIRTRNLTPNERVNGHAHCRALLLATSSCLNVVDGRLMLGEWQRVFLVELDGPRERLVSVMMLGEPMPASLEEWTEGTGAVEVTEPRVSQFIDQRSPSRPETAVKSSAEWLHHFEANAKNQREIPWDSGAGISPAELEEISNSLKGWQLGETSDGSHLLAAAATYAADVHDPLFVDVVRLFIAEEQRHGHNLGRFLDIAGIERATSDWGDTLFRRIRYSVPSMEVWATPVVMVETHALVYYDAIRQSSRSATLRGICDQILGDEVAHIRFQCERLAMLHRGRPGWLLALTKFAHRVLFAGITLAVWVGHGRAYRAGGYSFTLFWRAAWSRMRFAWRTMSPEYYQWP